MNKILSVHDSHLGKFETVSGIIVDILNPMPEQIDITDIATALSNICRFGGHVKPYYSVAQHCCLVAAMVPTHVQKYALLHDAAEAYAHDIIKPLKIILGEAYRIVEERFTNVIMEKFGLDLLIKLDSDQEHYKKGADHHMLELEDQALRRKNIAPLAGFIADNNWDTFGWAWKPEDAEQLFLATFKRLFEPQYHP